MAKMAQKWIEAEHRYIPYELPKGASCYEEDMDKKISCCVCGKKIKYGNSFTSRRIHTLAGIGYCECYDCYFDYQEKTRNNKKPRMTCKQYCPVWNDIDHDCEIYGEHHFTPRTCPHYNKELKQDD